MFKALFIMFLMYVISVLIGGSCWVYGLNHWLTFLDKTPSVTLFQGTLLSLIPGVGYIGVVLAILTFIIFLFI